MVGLRPGDLILSINGHALTRLGADLSARREAAQGDGRLMLCIRPVGTRQVVFRTAFLEPARARSLCLTEAHADMTVPVRPGQRFSVWLRGNITTGYEWRCARMTGRAVRQLGEPDYHPRPHPRRMAGTGGVFSFDFQAIRPGRATLDFVYQRPWETDGSAERTYRVTIVVVGDFPRWPSPPDIGPGVTPFGLPGASR
jgi:predicted secreted protein